MGEQAEQDCVCVSVCERVSFGRRLWEPVFRPLWCLHSSLLLLLERKSASPFLTLADFTASFPPLALPFLSLSLPRFLFFPQASALPPTPAAFLSVTYEENLYWFSRSLSLPAIFLRQFLVSRSH